MNIDLSPIMKAVEDVIARHERYIGYGRAREARAQSRLLQKMAAISNIYQDAGRSMESAPWYASLVMVGAVSAKSSAVNSTPSCLFRTDKPELDPARQRAYNRSVRAKTITLKGIDPEDLYSKADVVKQVDLAIRGGILQ